MGYYDEIFQTGFIGTVTLRRFLLVALVLLVYALHQDLWLWKSVHPLAFGFLPAGLTYHAAYTLVAAALMAVLVRFAWPSKLEREIRDRQPRAGGQN